MDDNMHTSTSASIDALHCTFAALKKIVKTEYCVPF